MLCLSGDTAMTAALFIPSVFKMEDLKCTDAVAVRAIACVGRKNASNLTKPCNFSAKIVTPIFRKYGTN